MIKAKINDEITKVKIKGKASNIVLELCNLNYAILQKLEKETGTSVEEGLKVMDSVIRSKLRK